MKSHRRTVSAPADRAAARSVTTVIAQHFPLYIRETGKPAGQAKTWLVVGWIPDRDSGLPRQPLVLLCDAEVEEPTVLEKTTPFQVVRS